MGSAAPALSATRAEPVSGLARMLRAMQRARLVLVILLGVLFVAAGVNHFVNEAFYVSIMPPWIP